MEFATGRRSGRRWNHVVPEQEQFVKAGIPETVVASVAAVCATVAAVMGHLSSDGLTAVYGAILGYIFGRVHNKLGGEKEVIHLPGEGETTIVHEQEK